MSSPTAHRHQVLVVDDSPDICEALTMMLDMEGYAATAVQSGSAALDELTGGFRPCVMLLDIRMPGTNGWDVWERMRADPELARTPVVIVSGESPDAARARDVGIRDVLRKPVDAGAVLAAVERYRACP